MILYTNTCFAQLAAHEVGAGKYGANQVIAVTDSLVLIKGTCKNMYGIAVIKEQKEEIPLKRPSPIIVDVDAPEPPRHWIKINGNVLYNFNYRSYLDTPFVERDIVQQSIQTRFDVNIKGEYPFTVFLTHRNSNSAYFANATDISVQFRRSNMLEGIKGKLRKEIDDQLKQENLLQSPEQIYRTEQGRLKGDGKKPVEKAWKQLEKDTAFRTRFLQLYNDYKAKKDSMNSLQQWVNSPMRFQQLVEEKEKRASDSILAILNKNREKGNTGNKAASPLKFPETIGKPFYKGRKQSLNDSTNEIFSSEKINRADSSSQIALQDMSSKKKQLDSLRKQVALAENRLKLFQKKTKDSLQDLKKQLAAVNNSQTLDNYLIKAGKDKAQLPGLQRALLSVNQIGIGRSWVDYSELTVKNISLNGANVEMNPGNIYLAGAMGKVNYRFRDFIVKGDHAGSSQSLGLLRLGYGRKDGNNLIATYYTGQKALLNQTGNADSMAVRKVNGFSLESRMAIDANNYLIAEYARSSNAGNGSKALDFSKRTNEAWSIKLFSEYPSTRTKLSAYYRRMGEGFQSFTLYPTNSKQDAWSVKMKQAFWKQRLSMEASVRKNDFSSPVAAPDFSSSTIFKSFQATLRVPKYPIVTVGFYPSTQLAMGGGNILYEQQFNTLNAIASHSYFAGNTNMGTSVVYTKFYNSGKDSGFIYYNASSCIFNQTVYKGPFVFQAIVTLTKQTDLKQRTIEPLVTYQLKSRLSVTGSVKWSDVNGNQTLWGGMAGLNLLLRGIGTIQVQYDKSYLPGYSRNLVPVSLGRVTFNRDF